MNDYLDPDHWVNGGEHDSMLPFERAFVEMEEKVKNAEAEINRLREDRDRIARELAILRLKHQGLQVEIEELRNKLAMPLTKNCNG